jgi:hypothetical protein
MLDINEFIFDENEDAVIMDCNSFVDLPAHMKPFVTFKNQRPYITNKQSFGKPVQYAFNEEERTVMGALISAGTPIYRNDNGKEYYGFFKKSTITKIQERMMKQGYMHNLNTMHDPKAVVKGAFLTNIFQVDAKKGIGVPETLKGQNLLDGSLIAIYKIEDQTLWSDIKSGKFRGFSIEAYLDIKKATVKKANMAANKKSTLWSRFFGEDEEEKVFAKGNAADGTIFTWEGELTSGTPIFMEVDGEQVPVPEGPYEVTMEDGTVKVVSVDANGAVASIEEMEEMAAVAEEILEVVAEVMSRKMKSQKESFEKRIEDQKKIIETLTKRIDALEADRKPSKYQDIKKPAAKTGADSPAWKTINK